MRTSTECKDKAAALRACSLATAMPHYKAKFEQIAREWDRMAMIAEARARLGEGQDAGRPDFRYH